MKIFVINLARRPDRLAEIDLDLKRQELQYEIVEAIDAKTNPVIKSFRRPLLATLLGKRAYSDNFIANYLSHRKIWQKMVDENIASALVLEDDAKISSWDSGFLHLNMEQLSLDVLRLGANVEPTAPENLLNTFPPDKVLGRELVTGKLWGNVATIFTLDAAKKFLHHKKYWFPSDDYVNFAKCFDIKYAIVNPLLWTTTGSVSDVEIVRKTLTPAQVLSLKLTKPLRRRILLPALQLYLRFITSRS